MSWPSASAAANTGSRISMRTSSCRRRWWPSNAPPAARL